MDDRTCNSCGVSFSSPSKLKRHQQRKTPCAPILEAKEGGEASQRTCKFCGRVFSSYTGMRRHVRATCKIAPNAKNGEKGMELLYEHTLRRQGERIADLEGRLARMAAGPPGPPGRDHIQVEGRGQVLVDNRQQNIVINVFGQEGVEHATAEKIKQILDESRAGGRLPVAADSAFVQTAMLVYSNPEHPENLTCYLPNKKTRDVLVHGERGWEVRPDTQVFPPMAKKSIDTLFDRQPFEDADTYAPIMRELANSEGRYEKGAELRPVLCRNKKLVEESKREPRASFQD